MADAAAIAAGLRAAFPYAIALGSAQSLAKRRSGNVVLVGAHDPPLLDRLRPLAAADPEPATLLGDLEAFIGGTPSWHDL
jgi:hypothetical protein